MYAAGNCVVFNRSVDPAERLERWRPCVLRGVIWQGGGAVTDRKLARAGSQMIFIPFGVRAGVPYAPPCAFDAAPGGVWTLREGDLILRGAAVPESLSLKDLLGAGAAAIVSVNENAFGRAVMRHWEVCAR